MSALKIRVITMLVGFPCLLLASMYVIVPDLSLHDKVLRVIVVYLASAPFIYLYFKSENKKEQRGVNHR
jgi:hypothetical protein